MCDLEERYATLKTPCSGYRDIRLIEKTEYKWLVELCGNGKRIEVQEDEFILDDR
jgi:hypothetical protein